jgi:predicted acetyltransferase
MEYRVATVSDAALLAELNQQLIRDEGQRNSMTLAELEERIARWLADTYEAVLFLKDGNTVGSTLFRPEEGSVYLRQFFVCRENRRQGIGREAIQWLRQHVGIDVDLIRMEVLCENSAGIDFWRAIGFRDYCLTMELDQNESAPR